jgi:hypothetical protein
MTRKGAKIGHPDGFIEAVGKWPKSNCLTIIKRRQELTSHIPIQLLGRDRTARQARQ